MNELNSLKQTLLELAKAREEMVNAGNLKDFGVYKQITGERTGLLIGIREIETLQQKRQQVDNVDD